MVKLKIPINQVNADDPDVRISIIREAEKVRRQRDYQRVSLMAQNKRLKAEIWRKVISFILDTAIGALLIWGLWTHFNF